MMDKVDEYRQVEKSGRKARKIRGSFLTRK